MSPYRWTIEKVMTATDGRLVCGSAQLDLAGIAIDSRTVLPDQLFVAIAGNPTTATVSSLRCSIAA